MKTTVWLLSLFLLLAACNAESPEPEFELTPATQIGANTLSFRVNGRVWQPYGRRCFGFGGGPCIEVPLDAYYNSKRGQFIITAFLTTSKRGENFGLSCDSLFQTGIFVIPPRGTKYRARSGGISYGLAQQSGDPTYNSFDPSRTRIEIARLDTIARVISGTFEGYLQGTIDRSQSVTISEGRFDVKY